MFESKLERVTEESLLSQDLLQLYDEITEFNDYCSFLCDAFSCLVAEEGGMEVSTVQGFSRQSDGMKRQMETLKEKLKKIHQKACIQNKKQSQDTM